MDNIRVELPLQLDSVGTYELQGYNDLFQKPINGTVYHTLSRRFPMFFNFMNGSLLVNRLNDPYTQRFTIFIPKLPIIHSNINKDQILESSIVPYVISLEELRQFQSMQLSEGSIIKVTDNGRNIFLNKSRVLDGNIQCSNGIIHVVDKVIEPYLLNKYEVY